LLRSLDNALNAVIAPELIFLDVEAILVEIVSMAILIQGLQNRLNYQHHSEFH